MLDDVPSYGWGIGNTQIVSQVLSESFVPLSFVSEYTRNSIQAIQRRGVGNKVVWGPKEVEFNGKKIRKLSITDNGPGLSDDPNEIQRLIGGLASSGYQTAINQNHGCGAKASAAMWNALGVLYRTWVVDKYGQLRSYRVAINPQGLMALGDGDLAVEEVDPYEGRPDMIEDHGTEVIFMGNTQDQDTNAEVGEGKPLAAYRILKYLNTRFFDIPEDIEVYAPRGQKRKDGQLRMDRVDGFRRCWMESGTKRVSNPLILDYGAIPLADVQVPATIRYFVLSDEPSGRKSRAGIFDARPSIAFLYEDELYTHRGGPDAVKMLSSFVGMACDRVVLVIEPDASMVNPEGGRQVLRFKGDELSFDIWSTIFRDNLPESIRKIQDRKRQTHEVKFDSETISNNLKQYYPELISLGGVRAVSGTASPSGEGTRPPIAEGDPPGGGGGTKGTPEKDPTPPQPKIADIIQRISPGLNKVFGKGAAYKFPGCQWLSANPSQYYGLDQKPQDFLPNKAASYDQYENMVRCNWDFFLDRYELLCEEYSDFRVAYGDETVQKVIQIAIQTLYANVLAEAVGATMIRRNEWEPREVHLATSEAALTTTVIGRSRIEEIRYAISQYLQDHFGKDQQMKEMRRKHRGRLQKKQK